MREQIVRMRRKLTAAGGEEETTRRKGLYFHMHVVQHTEPATAAGGRAPAASWPWGYRPLFSAALMLFIPWAFGD